MEVQPIFQDLALEAIIIVLDITQEIAITHKQALGGRATRLV